MRLFTIAVSAALFVGSAQAAVPRYSTRSRDRLCGFSVGAFGVKHFRQSFPPMELRLSLAGARLLFGIGASALP
jgi:hypothetical protein